MTTNPPSTQLLDTTLPARLLDDRKNGIPEIIQNVKVGDLVTLGTVVYSNEQEFILAYSNLTGSRVLIPIVR